MSLYTISYDVLDADTGSRSHSGSTTVRAINEQHADDEARLWVLEFDYLVNHQHAPKVRITDRVLTAA